MLTAPYIGGKNRPFSTGGYTDTRGLGPDLPIDFSTSGTYEALNNDNELYGPSNPVYNIVNAVIGGAPRNSSERKKIVEDLFRSDYNKAYGPGASSSIPPLSDRDKLKQELPFLKKALGNRKDKRPGGTPKRNK